jgi:hypothetical protein
LWVGVAFCLAVPFSNAECQSTWRSRIVGRSFTQSKPGTGVELTFTITSGGDCVLSDGGTPTMVKNSEGKEVAVPCRTTLYKASNGETAHLFGTDLISQKFAAEYLEEKLKGANVIERKPRINKQGVTIGERIVALLNARTEPHKRGPNDPHKSVPTIILTVGTSYYELSSNSLEVALALDAYLGKNGAPADKK